MDILEYAGLDTSRVKKSYGKVVEAIARGDFKAAQVKKLVHSPSLHLYRAKLDDANRLIFTLVRVQSEVYALMLEVVLNHNYEKSRFLRGAIVDEAKISEASLADAQSLAEPLRYLHQSSRQVRWLDKPISFDSTQAAVFDLPAPVILVGSAGSGKTALTLEKLKEVQGEVLYVTHSAFLAQSARDLYFAHGFECEGQVTSFLSYREFVESIKIPEGRESRWQDFSIWFARMRQQFKELDAHQAFEEIRGVITAAAGGVRSREDYLALGMRQSIYSSQLRNALYDLYEKYRVWLKEQGLYEINLIAHDWSEHVRPSYDFVVVDEVQDLTQAQLALILKTLRKPDQFLLCGDSNQIVHPNFFSWAQVRGLFWGDVELAERKSLQVLSANFRNGQQATRLANQLLKIKNQRFGSIDRESNFLVQAVSVETGKVHLMQESSGTIPALDRDTRQSTQFAVLVMRDEDKANARRHFATPLLFSIHEAKGLEYDNIVLYRFVSDHRAEFEDICDGVTLHDLVQEELSYRRARDKSDKSLEVYKFFVNALYVAITRAVKNVYLVESDVQHALFGLLQLERSGSVHFEAKKSSVEDWQKEARKLELQGKQEQAEAIRERILKLSPVPWPVFDQAHTVQLLTKVFLEQAPGNKYRQQVHDIATCHNAPSLAENLALETGLTFSQGFKTTQPSMGRKSYLPYFANNYKEILRQCERFGLEHRLPMNQTPLMAAAAAGNLGLVEALISRGADPEAVDNFGQNALHWAMREAFQDEKFAAKGFAEVFKLLAPSKIDVEVDDRLVRIDQQQSEYMVFQTMWALFRMCFTHLERTLSCGFDTQSILSAWKHLPPAVLRPERNRRAHLSSVLSRNELHSSYEYKRSLFRRAQHGWYQFNPSLKVRRTVSAEQHWLPVFEALNLDFIREFANRYHIITIDDFLDQVGKEETSPPISFAPAFRRERAEEERLRQEQERKEERLRLEKQRLEESLLKARADAEARRVERARKLAEPPPWGTKAAKRLEIERVRRAIEERKKREEGGIS